MPIEKAEEPDEAPPPYTLDSPPAANARRGRYRTDPRLTPRHRFHRGIPLPVLNILARHLAASAQRPTYHSSHHRPLATLAALSLTCRRIYQAVIPHLYHTIPITRDTLPKLLYGIDLSYGPHTFRFKPDERFPEKLVDPAVPKRRKECFGYILR